jgi:hypothetical protein
MKKCALIILLLFNVTVQSQTLKEIEKDLNNLIEKRNNCIESKTKNSSDSLSKFNIELEKLVLKFTSSNPETLTHKFKDLRNGLSIITSEDGQFRIYNWNTLEGGTMQYHKNVFQYKANGKTCSKLSKIETEYDDSSVDFFEINDVKVNSKHYYVTSSVFIGSTAIYYYEVKIFSIENGKLNEDAKLIKTKSGIKNTIGYEIDLSNSANRDRKDGVISRDYISLIYDKKNKTIIIPLINGDGKITKKKIKYKFKGKYFEKI